jgi:arylsulfatase A-like enzyme
MKTPVFTLLFAALVSMTTAGTSPPNIVVMLIDDMGVMDTSVPFLTGNDGQPKRYPLNDFYRTPNMERLAAHSRAAAAAMRGRGSSASA